MVSYETNGLGEKIKKYTSATYNYEFNMVTGVFKRWGATMNDDPHFAPHPEICDWELNEICHGPRGIPCPFCYKGNVGNKGRTITFETFKTIFDTFNPALTQIAFGIGDLPHKIGKEWSYDLWKICEYTRENNVIPNITINGDRLTDEVVSNLVKYMGAVSVSYYGDDDLCFDAIKRLQDAGLKQLNIHAMYHAGNIPEILTLIYKVKIDPRLKNLNALVLLALKQKGRGTTFQPISKEGFKEIIDYALELGVPLGFDSCSAHRFTEYAKERSEEWFESIEHMIEPCESFGMFSSYINVEGKYFPCSFMEGSCADWMKGIDCTKIKSFTDEVWKTPLLNKWKLISLKNNRNCPVFTV